MLKKSFVLVVAMSGLMMLLPAPSVTLGQSPNAGGIPEAVAMVQTSVDGINAILGLTRGTTAGLPVLSQLNSLELQLNAIQSKIADLQAAETACAAAEAALSTTNNSDAAIIAG